MSIAENIKNIKNRISVACKNCSRDEKSVQLMLVTKTIDVRNIKLALDTGQNLVGENKAQDLRQKSDFFSQNKADVHFIGHLQTNKIKDVVPYSSCIQSLDSLNLAQKLHNYLEASSQTMEVLIQVNVSNEDSKFGIQPNDVVSFVEKMENYQTLKIRGLMTIGLFSDDLELVRFGFKTLKKTQETVIKSNFPNVNMDVLSMGMSKDLEVAIEEGSTLIRIGTDIFGKRNKK